MIVFKSVPIEFDAQRFGKDCLASRIECGFAILHIETLCGIADSHIARIEQGLESNPKINTLLALCNLYDLKPNNYFTLREA